MMFVRRSRQALSALRYSKAMSESKTSESWRECQRQLSTSTLTRLKSVPATYPILFGATFTCTKTCAADLFVQTYVEKKEWEDVDFRRTATFAIFGFGYMGVAQYFVYVHLMARLLFPNAAKFAAKSLKDKMKDRQGIKDLFSQVAIDQIVHLPFVFYPCYYFTKCAIMERPVGHEDDSLLGLTFYKWKTNFFDDLKTSCVIWIPANLINFGLMPMHFRISFMAVISFGFCVVLSVTRGSEKPKIKKEAARLARTKNNVGEEHIVEIVKNALHRLHLKTSRESNSSVDYDEFVDVMREAMHVEDAGVLRSIFDACDRDGDGAISASELSTLLLAFCRSANGTVTDEERCGIIFDCVDLDASGYITFNEAKAMVRGLLSVREVLLEHGGEINIMDSMDFISGGGSGTYQKRENETADEEKLKKIRLIDLRQRYKKFRNNKDATLAEILDYEASRLSQKLLAEADVVHSDNRISRDEFTQWIHSESDSSKKFLSLFNLFGELLGESE